MNGHISVDSLDLLETVGTWLATRIPATRPFIMRRDIGTDGATIMGVVADGVQFPSAGKNRVAIRWRGEFGSTVVWDNIRDARRIHGSDRETIIEWVPLDTLFSMLSATVTALEDALAEDAPSATDSLLRGWADGLAKELHDILTQDAPQDGLIDPDA